VLSELLPKRFTFFIMKSFFGKMQIFICISSGVSYSYFLVQWFNVHYNVF